MNATEFSAADHIVDLRRDLKASEVEVERLYEERARFRDTIIRQEQEKAEQQIATLRAERDEADENGYKLKKQLAALRVELESLERIDRVTATALASVRAESELQKRQMGLAAKYIGEYYDLARDMHDPTALTDVGKIDAARRMVFAIGADTKRILEEGG